MEYEPIEFVFSDEERKLAADEGYRRYKIDVEIGAKGRNGGPAVGDEAQLINLIGTAGEMAVASYLGLKEFLYKEKLPVRGSFDIPPNIDVKTAMCHRHNLIIKFDDNPSYVYVLVTIENKKCIIHGWVTGERVMKPIFEGDPVGGRPAYFVPKGLLNPIHTLFVSKELLIKSK
jgi:hypothetical protein